MSFSLDQDGTSLETRFHVRADSCSNKGQDVTKRYVKCLILLLDGSLEFNSDLYKNKYGFQRNDGEPVQRSSQVSNTFRQIVQNLKDKTKKRQLGLLGSRFLRCSSRINSVIKTLFTATLKYVSHPNKFWQPFSSYSQPSSSSPNKNEKVESKSTPSRPLFKKIATTHGLLFPCVVCFNCVP